MNGIEIIHSISSVYRIFCLFGLWLKPLLDFLQIKRLRVPVAHPINKGFVGIFGPPDMPPARRAALSALIREIAADPALAERLRSGGQEARGSTPEAFAALIAAQRAQVEAGLAVRARRG